VVVEPEGVGETRHVADQPELVVVGGMIRLPVPSLVERHHPEAVGQTAGNGVPGSSVLGVGVQQHHGWGSSVAPVAVVEA
jgi:hypothetical protein